MRLVKTFNRFMDLYEVYVDTYKKMIKQIIAKMSAKYTLDVGVGVPLDKELDDDTFELVSPFRTMVPKHRHT